MKERTAERQKNIWGRQHLNSEPIRNEETLEDT